MKRKIVSGIMLTPLLIGMLILTFNTLTASAILTATIDIHPETLNLKSKGKWITTYIELPEGYTVSADLKPTAIGDYDNDTIPDLMVKFNRTAVSEQITTQGITYGNVTLTITGKVGGIPFEGSDIIIGRMPGDVNSNGIVDIVDVVTVAVALGSTDPYTDLNEDEITDICDIVTVAINFGNTY